MLIRFMLLAAILLGSQVALSATLTLTAKESSAVRHLLAEDLSVWSTGGATMLRPTGVVVTADKMQRDYEKNEVAGDLSYRGKLVLVSGTVRSIDRGIGSSYFVLLKGGSNPFMTPRARMADGFEQYLAKLYKGQKVTLACQGDGMLIGSATLARCRPVASWVEDEATRTMTALPAKFAESGSTVQLPITAIVAIAGLLPDSSPCFSNDASQHGRCARDAEAAQAAKGNKGRLKTEAISAASRLGVKLPS